MENYLTHQAQDPNQLFLKLELDYCPQEFFYNLSKNPIISSNKK